jgi:hypothetical protein
MADLLGLAYQRLTQHGMTAAEATDALEQFVNGPGRDIPWRKVYTILSKQLAERIDQAAMSWCVAHRLTGETVVEPAPRMIRDGKMLATGESI